MKNLHSTVVKLPKVDTLEIELSHAREAIKAIYEAESLEEAQELAFVAADKMTLGSPEQILD